MSLITKEVYNNQENRKKAVQIDLEIAQYFLQTGGYPGGNVPIAAYLLCKVSQDNDITGITMQSIFDGRLNINEDIRYFAKEHISEDVWMKLLLMVGKYTAEEFALAAVIQDYESDSKFAMTTPDSILRLVHCLWSVSAGDKVADLCCGTGSYSESEAFNQTGAHFFGYEVNVESYTVALMRSELLDSDIHVQLCDVFSLPQNENVQKFDKIFSNYPFGMRLRFSGEGADYMERLSDKYPGISKGTSSDWVFNALLCDLLAEDGKAIAIMTNGGTWNTVDIQMRKYFVEKKMVECVITLPNRIFPYTNVGTTLIVFSRNNEAVRMIDASQICQQGRRQNEFSDENIETIVEALHTDAEYSKEVSIEELRANEYNLSLERYVQKAPAFDNGVPFGSIIKSISRGAPCTANQLDTMISNKITDMQYLMLANIQNGMIDDRLPYLTSIEPKYEKYCLKNNDLILSKNGYPYKVAVATVKEGQRILANGNLYIIELDESLANPYYVKAFLESKQGVATLKSITVGVAIPNIGVDKLKKILIPLPPMEEQNKIAQRYQAAQDEISLIKIRLERAIDKLHRVFDEESAENNA